VSHDQLIAAVEEAGCTAVIEQDDQRRS